MKKLRDRRDARRVDIPMLMQCCIDLKPNRHENEVYINRKVDITNLVNFINDKKEEGIHYTYFHAFLTAIAKVIYNRPKLNRFITNRHLYEHNSIVISFVAKVTLDDKSEELMFCIPVDPNDNIESLAEKIKERVDKLRANKTEKKGANEQVDILGKLPNVIRVPIFGLIKFLDKIDLLPSTLSKNNIYFSSMIVSNLGSIKCGAIYHNLIDFGTCSSLTAIGEIENIKKYNDDGTEEMKKVCEFGITLDERIGDGFYYAKSVSMIEQVLANPESLLQPVNAKIEF